MESTLIIISVLLILFAILAVYDGFYLHIFKYNLHNHSESKNEHITHTVRAILFPAIVYFLFFRQNSTCSFFIGISLVIIDSLVLVLDAYVESDSRKFMGGLPRWEYVLHLFVNGFHFASIAVFLTMKLQFTDKGISIVQNFYHYQNFSIFNFVVKNIIPGAVIIGILHLMVSIPKTAIVWNNFRAKISCC
ncbi:MAG: hypothetical protein ABI426_08765 [Flavobacterium sp.]